VEKYWAELLMDDHQTTERVFDAVERAFAQPGGPTPRVLEAFLEYATDYVDGCHNLKEENHLFPLAESRGVPRDEGPLAVMLMEHQRSRELMTRLAPLIGQYLAGQRQVRAELEAAFKEYAELLKGHYWKENDILYPLARRAMSEQDAQAVLAGIEAEEAKHGPDTHARYYALAHEIERLGEVKDLAFDLSHEVIGAIFNTLPVELSFVDEQDTVRYFSHEHQKKIFPRTRGAIGMPVQKCHPQKSVHLVKRILEDFKAGRREVAEFWIDMAERKVHIRYYPVRDLAGKYLGCLEVVQDVAPLQQLEGQRRLLDEG
jgi:hypothetical protein